MVGLTNLATNYVISYRRETHSSHHFLRALTFGGFADPAQLQFSSVVQRLSYLSRLSAPSMQEARIFDSL